MTAKKKAQAPKDVKTTRRTDDALHPTTPLEIMVSRALDQELEWWFAYGESALHRDRVRILPSYAAAPILATDPSEEALGAHAVEIATTVKRCLLAVRGKHAEVLRAAYTPRSWPKPVVKAMGPVAAVAVRMAFADDPWPERPSRTGLEQAAAARLAAAIKSGSVPVGRLRSQASRLLGAAIVAYADARALEPGAPGAAQGNSR